ncbi:MAG: N4-gp56 family major capsid protein [Kiritimatiellales bacterium]
MIEIYGLNLQMFADASIQTTLLSGLSAEQKTYYEKRLIDHAEPELVHNQFGMKKAIPQGSGKTIEFRYFSPLAKKTAALTEGVVPDGDNMTVNAITATALQYGNYVTSSDLIEMTAYDPWVLQVTRELASQAGRSIDTLTRDVINGGSQVMYAPYVSGETITATADRSEITANSKLTLTEIFEAVAELRTLNAKMIDGGLVAIIHPFTEMDLMLSDDWKEAVKYQTANKIYQGEIGMIGGVRFVRSTEAKVIAPSAICGVLSNRLSLKTALDASPGSVDIYPTTAIATADAATITAAISAGAVYTLYVGGTEGTVASVTAGAAGTCKITLTEAITSKSVGAVICGPDAGADGSAVFMTMVLGADAYGVIEISGGGLQHIVKPRGSAGTADPLDQISTVGWKTTHVAKRLVEEYMMRVEHGTSKSATVQSN